MKKSSNSFSLLLSFRDFSANVLCKNSSSEDALRQPVIYERFALLRRYLYFDKGGLALAATAFEKISAGSSSAIVHKK